MKPKNISLDQLFDNWLRSLMKNEDRIEEIKKHLEPVSMTDRTLTVRHRCGAPCRVVTSIPPGESIEVEYDRGWIH